jgi:hypothetical protein
VVATQAEPAARRRLQRVGHLIGFRQVLQDLSTTLVILPTDFGETHTACRAAQQTHTKDVFERLDLVTYRCCRQIEAARCRSEAAALDDANKGGETGHPIHAFPQDSNPQRSHLDQWLLSVQFLLVQQLIFELLDVSLVLFRLMTVLACPPGGSRYSFRQILPPP